MHMRNLAVLLLAIVVGSCTNRNINFDQLPDGTPLQGWAGTPLRIGPPFVITNEYASRGVAQFSSAGGGVFLRPDPDAPSQPNEACPYGPAGLLDFSEPTTVQLTDTTCNVWVTIPPGFNQVTINAYDSGGALLGTVTSTGPNATTMPGGAKRVRVNFCGISRVEMSSSSYCFDDFTWQDEWF